MRIIIPVLLVIFYACASCTTSDDIIIYFKNNSDKYLDSAVVYLNNYKCSVRNIKPDDNINIRILNDSITLNNHDTTIRVYLFDKNKTRFNGGFYYDDLSGSFNDQYQISLNKDMKIIINSTP